MDEKSGRYKKTVMVMESFRNNCFRDQRQAQNVRRGRDPPITPSRNATDHGAASDGHKFLEFTDGRATSGAGAGEIWRGEMRLSDSCGPDCRTGHKTIATSAGAIDKNCHG